MNPFHFIRNDIYHTYKEKGLKYLVKLLVNSQARIALDGNLSKDYEPIINRSKNIHIFDGKSITTWSKDKIILDYCDELLQKRASRLKIRQWLLKTLYKTQYINNQDLLFNSLDGDAFSISINRQVYRFTLNELLKIIDNHLGSYNEYCFITPQLPKNPYTNQVFNELDIKRIYSYIESRGKISELFNLFKISHFNLQIFIQQQREYLTYHACKLKSKQFTLRQKIDLLNEIYQEECEYIGQRLYYFSETISFLDYHKSLLNQLLADFYICKQYGDIYASYYSYKYINNYKYLMQLYGDYKGIQSKKNYVSKRKSNKHRKKYRFRSQKKSY